MKPIFTLIILGVAILCSNAYAFSDKPYDAAGIIEEIRTERNEILINDQAYIINSQVLVHENGRTQIGIRHLSNQQPIGFTIDTSANIINEVWLINANEAVDQSVLDD